MLYIFAGLPGTGKTTLSRALARHTEAVFLRIDSIEHALAAYGTPASGPEGYVVAYAVARDNLLLGKTVVADSVNPLRVTRETWRQIAVDAGAPYKEIEIVCSDPVEHRHRVENRSIDIAGFRPPTWDEVTGRERDPWDTTPLRIDTAGRTPDESVAELLAGLGLEVPSSASISP